MNRWVSPGQGCCTTEICRPRGRFDDESTVLEGDWRPTRLAIVEFDNVERARQWYQSAEYAEAKPILHRTARANLILIEGA